MRSVTGAVHLATIRRQHKDRVYETHLLRQSYREGGKVKNRTLGNLSHLPAETLDLVRRNLAGEHFLSASSELVLHRSLGHGHVVAVLGLLRQLGLDVIIEAKRSRQRDLCVALIAAQLLHHLSKLGTTRAWGDTTLPAVLEIEDADEDELYAALDWLLERQSRIEAKLAARHLGGGAVVLYDLTSSYVEGRHCPPAKLGYSRDGKKGTLQIEYGLVTDAEGRPVAVEVVEGNTGDPATVAAVVERLKVRFGLSEVILVGDRGMLTSARIEDLRALGGIAWISSLRSPQIQALVESGSLQLGLFDRCNLAEIRDPGYPDERLVVCKNPLLAEERARKREDLLQATEAKLAPIVEAVAAGRLHGAAAIGLRVGRVLGKYKMGKHFELAITDTSLTITRKAAEIAAETALDGIYVVRTSVAEDRLDSAAVVRTYKRLSHVERAFRGMKSVDLRVRPIRHRRADRVRAHILLCMLAYYVQWHLERAWAPLLFRDEDRPIADDPVAPAERSEPAQRKASSQRLADGTPVHDLHTLLGHMASLTRNRMALIRAADAPTFEVTSEPTPLQARALSLLGLTPITL